MKRHFKSFMLPLVAISLLTAGLGVAYAHDMRADSEIVNFRYNDDKDRFQGKVVSERQACVRNRLVQVREDLPNRNRLVGEDRTNENGFFRVADLNPRGDYFARVLRKVRTREGHRHVCQGDRSEEITITDAHPSPTSARGDAGP